MRAFVKLRNHDSVNQAVQPSFLTVMIASGLYSGYVPAFSGTVGSVVAILFYAIPGFESAALMIPIVLLSFIAGIFTSATLERRYGHDPAEVTIDEIVGMWITLLLVPKTFSITIIAFILFRFFDIVKPFPIQKIDALSGGLSIMLDDVVAGIYGNICIHLLLLIPFLKDIFLKL
ncbi:MAG TPA: phosphatidylglycerophosphatase A [Bacteroidota bacterium]|nr:phosphatidylglycerophosphatase A [Bacteroidota bacterium]